MSMTSNSDVLDSRQAKKQKTSHVPAETSHASRVEEQGPATDVQQLNVKPEESIVPLPASARQQLLGVLANAPSTPLVNLITRKLKSPSTRLEEYLKTALTPEEVHPLPPLPETPGPDEETLAALYAIKRTPFHNSFLSRLHGCRPVEPKKVISVDWDARAPWMDLMDDIRDHYLLSHMDEDPIYESSAPIIYEALKEEHIMQVHDLLHRSFWEGIDVRDALIWEPEKCTVVATYKRLVVGVALLSEPNHAYVTYLAVKAGWENAHIGTKMLYHLIQLNPGRHITLHVSANNPAMLLYNRFGFKAEQFIVGFYDSYMDPNSRMSKNAFLLRLRP